MQRFASNNKSDEPLMHETILRQAGEGTTVGVVGDIYRFLATGEETNGAYALVDAIVPPGGGPPPHRHSREDEAFYVTEGEITFTIDGRQAIARAGTFASAPRGTLHSFRNNSQQTARMLIHVVPAGIEKMFLEIGVPLPPGATTGPPPDAASIEKLIQIAPKYGIELQKPGH
jgi:quercetin dioxygenase-like cupin family protein